MQVDVGEQRRDGRSLPRSPLRNLDPSVFENARPKAISWIRRRTRLSPMRCSRDRASHSLFTESKNFRNVGVDNVIHLPGVISRRQGVERASAPRPGRNP